jgi:hypothetical protein
MNARHVSAVIVALACAISSPAEAQRILKSEPQPGSLAEREIVLVDDGTCPADQIKEVTGGSNHKASGGRQIGTPRTTKCIPRPAP